MKQLLEELKDIESEALNLVIDAVLEKGVLSKESFLMISLLTIHLKPTGDLARTFDQFFSKCLKAMKGDVKL